MAYNPPLTNQGLPCKVEGELFVLQRKDMEIEVKIDGNKQWGKKSGKGIMFLTSCRIVFVNEKWRTSDFKAFDIPLTNMRKESFEQPVFGSNYLKGNVLPLFNLIPGEAQFKLWFKSGGCGTFLKMCDSVLKQVRRNRNSNRQGPDQRFMNDVQSGNIQKQQALFDPNDPSTIFINQPNLPKQDNQQMHNFYGNFQGENPYYTDNNLSNNNQFSQPPQNNQFNQPPQNNYNQPNKQQQPQPFQQGDTFQQYNQNQQYNQVPQGFPVQPEQQAQQGQQYQPYQQGQPEQQGQQYQPYQQGENFQQYNPQQQQYQNNPSNPQNYQFNQQQLDQQQQLNAPPQYNQPQQKQYFGFWGPNLQQGNQQQQQQQQNTNNNQQQNTNNNHNYPEI